jgi:hypothetical protein
MPCRHQKRDHTLCFECYRSERERQRAMLPLEPEAAPPIQVPLPAAAVAGSLGDRQLEHRRTMLAHQELTARLR